MSSDTDILIDTLAGDLRPVRPMRFAEGMALVALAGGATLALVALGLGIREDVRTGVFSPMFLIADGLFLLLGLAAATAVVQMGSPQIGGRHDGWKWALATAALLPLAALIMAVAQWSDAPHLFMPRHDFFCLASGSILGLITGVALTFWLRRGAPASPGRAGLLAGIASGAIGMFAYSFSCPLDSIFHVGIWHSLPVLICALAGRAVIPPLIRW